MKNQKHIQNSKLKISISREELHSLLNKNNIISEEVVAKSQALDKLIVEYHNIFMGANDKIR